MSMPKRRLWYVILIWVVQIIVYPTFHKIKNEEFVDWHRKYCNAIGFFVLPVMSCQLLEAASACFSQWVI